jgi:hypothetical protein
MYIDFIFKQILEYFIRNILVYTSLFFGEKYIIEYLTKKTIDSFVFSSNSLINVSDLSFHDFFFIASSFIIYFLLMSMLVISIL